jgi:hypothetical protein
VINQILKNRAPKSVDRLPSDSGVTFFQTSAAGQIVIHLRPKIVISLVKDYCKRKTTNSLRVRASRFFSDRYAYRERPDYLIELVAFGIIVITVTLSLASAMTTT